MYIIHEYEHLKIYLFVSKFNKQCLLDIQTEFCHLRPYVHLDMAKIDLYKIINHFNIYLNNSSIYIVLQRSQ